MARGPTESTAYSSTLGIPWPGGETWRGSHPVHSLTDRLHRPVGGRTQFSYSSVT